MADDNQNNNNGGTPWLLIALLGFMFWRFPKITLTLLAAGALIVAIIIYTSPTPKSYDANDYLLPSQHCPRTEYVNGQPQNVECAGADLARWRELQDKLDKERAADADAQWQQEHKQ